METGESLAERIDECMRSGKVALPVCDPVAMRVYRAVRKGDLGAAELAQLLATDPVLSSEVLRAANSSFFTGLGEVRRLKDAIVRLGGRQIASLAMAASQKRLYSASAQHFRTRLVSLWRHAHAAAYGSGWLAAKLGQRRLQEEAFLAGLLHDVGKLSLLRALEDLVAADQRLRELPEAVIDEALLHLHAAHGQKLLTMWNIPEVFSRTAARHHDPQFDSSDTTLVIVRLVNKAARQSDPPIQDGREGDTPLEVTEEARALGLGEIQIAELQVALDEANAALV